MQFKRVIFAFVLALAISSVYAESDGSQDNEEEYYTPINLKFDDDYTLSVRACLTAVIGREYLYSMVNETFNQYVDRFNEKTQFSAEYMEEMKDIRIVNNVLNTEHNDFHYTVQRLSPNLTVTFEGSTTVF